MRPSISKTDALQQHPVVRAVFSFLKQHYAASVVPQLNSVQKNSSVLSPVFIALSGGADSIALAHALYVLRQQGLLHAQCVAIHVNHGISPHATAWQHLVEQFCDDMGVTLHVKQVVVHSKNIEASARAARYAAIAEVCALYPQQHHNRYAVCIAHHANDQIETFFMRLFAGSGVQGLGAMRAYRPRGVLQLCRPLLSVTRRHIEEYVAHAQLPYVDDEANADAQYARTWLRHTFWPFVLAKHTHATDTVLRSIKHIQEQEQLLQQLLQPHVALCLQGDALLVEKLVSFPEIQQRAILRVWLSRWMHYLPNEKVMHQLQNMLYAQQDRQPEIRLPEGTVHRYKQVLYFVQKTPQAEMQISAFEPITLHLDAYVHAASGVWQVQTQQGGLPYALLQSAGLTLCTRQGGEMFHFKGRVGRWPLKKMLQWLEIPPWQRALTQLLIYNTQCIGVLTVRGFVAVELPPELCALKQLETQVGWSLVHCGDTLPLV